MLHTPVLAEVIVEWLAVKPEGTYVDATVGTGGHALGILQRLTTGRLVGLDRDPEALAIARERLKQFERRVTLVHTDFSKIGDVVSELELPKLDGVLADLGVSSLELDTPERGFSFRWGGPLDMRMNPDYPFVAEEIVNHWPETRAGRCALQIRRRARITQDRQGDCAGAAHPRHRTPGNGCGRGPKSKGKAETAPRDKNVSGAADSGESRVGGTRAVSF